MSIKEKERREKQQARLLFFQNNAVATAGMSSEIAILIAEYGEMLPEGATDKKCYDVAFDLMGGQELGNAFCTLGLLLGVTPERRHELLVGFPVHVKKKILALVPKLAEQPRLIKGMALISPKFFDGRDGI